MVRKIPYLKSNEQGYDPKKELVIFVHFLVLFLNSLSLKFDLYLFCLKDKIYDCDLTYSSAQIIKDFHRDDNFILFVIIVQIV